MPPSLMAITPDLQDQGGAADRWRPLAAHRPPAPPLWQPIGRLIRFTGRRWTPSEPLMIRRTRRPPSGGRDGSPPRKPPPPADRRVPRAAPTASVVTAVPSFDRPPTLRRFVSQFADDRRRRPQRPIPAGNFGAGPTTRRRLRRLPLGDRRPIGDRRTAPQAHRRRRLKRRRRRVGRSVDWKIGAECDAPCAQ